MNIEQAVLENLRLLPSEKQQDVLVFIYSLLPPAEFITLDTTQTKTLTDICTATRQIQSFHDGLPSAVYADRLLRSTQSLITHSSNDPIGEFAQALYQSLATNNRWSYYTIEYYQTLHTLLTRWLELPNLKPDEIRAAVQTLNTISQSMTQSGTVSDRELNDCYVEA